MTDTDNKDTKNVPFSFTLPTELFERLSAIATRDRRTRASLIRWAVEEWLQKYDQPDQPRAGLTGRVLLTSELVTEIRGIADRLEKDIK